MGVTGIDVPSFAMIDMVTTVRRGNCIDPIGRPDPVHPLELERPLLVFLDLAH